MIRVLVRLKSRRRALHDALLPLRNVEWPVFGPHPGRFLRLEHESAVETLPGPQLLLADLMADRAIHAILRLFAFFRFGVERQMRENLAFASLFMRQITRHR